MLTCAQQFLYYKSNTLFEPYAAHDCRNGELPLIDASTGVCFLVCYVFHFPVEGSRGLSSAADSLHVKHTVCPMLYEYPCLVWCEGCRDEPAEPWTQPHQTPVRQIRLRLLQQQVNAHGLGKRPHTFGQAVKVHPYSLTFSCQESKQSLKSSVSMM